jgi:hypothetical protein
MAQYRCYLLDGSGKIVAFEDLEAGTIDEALVTARELLGKRQSHTFELWQGRERIHKERRATTLT